MKKEKKRTSKKINGDRVNKRNKNNRTNRKYKKSKKKSIQKGGAGLLPAIGVGLIATSVAAAAYKGFRLINKIKDKTHLLRLLNKDYVEYAPKVVVTETSDFIKYYLQCVSTYEFFQILLSRPEYLKSRTLQHIIKDASLKEKRSKSDLDDNYGGEFSDIDKIITALHSKQNSDIQGNLSLKPGLIETSKNKYISDIKNLLLLTARIPGSNLEDDSSMIEKINPYITVSSFRWMDVIIKGVYDEYFDSAVNEILDERNISQSLHKDEMERIQGIIEGLNDNQNFRSAIRKKMLECSSKPRGFLDYINSNVSWDSQKGCLSCPQQDCLIYIYDFYYDFLKENSDLPIVDKLYALMICEARICVLSKCLALEAIRVQDNNDKMVRQLIHQIYKADIDSPFDKIKESSIFSDMFFQKGGSIAAQPDGSIAAQSDGSIAAQSDGSIAAQPDVSIAAQSDGSIAAQSDGSIAAQSDGSIAAQSDGSIAAQSDGSIAAQSDGSIAAQSDGSIAAQPDVSIAAQYDGSIAAQSDGSIAAQPDVSIAAQSDGSIAAQPDGSMMAQPNIQPATEDYLQSEKQKVEKPDKTSNEQILEDLIKTQLELFMKTSEETNKETFLQKLNLSLVDVENIDKIYEEYVKVKVINDMIMKDFIMNLFIDKDEYIENLEILYNFIKKDGILLMDIYSLEKLREDNILFNGSDLRDDEKLALYMKSLDGNEETKAFSLLLLRMSDSPQVDNSGKCLSNPDIENLLFIMDDNSEMLNEIIKHLFSLLTESNKEELLKRIATVYNSLSIEKRKTMDRVDIMYHDVSVDKSVFDIPDFSIKVDKDKPKTLKKSSKSRNPICIQKENEFMRKVRSKEPIVIDSTTLSSLERCAVRKDINESDEQGSKELNDDIISDNLETPAIEQTPPLETPAIEQTPPLAPAIEQTPPLAPPIEQTPPLETPAAIEQTPPLATPAIEQTPPVVAPAIEQTPPVVAPAIEQTPPVVAPPAIEQTPPVVAPAIEQTPPVVAPPAIEQTPPVVAPPAIEQTPPVVAPTATLSAIEQTPPVVAPPAIEQTPPVVAPPAIEQTPPVVAPPAIEQTPPVVAPPAIEQTPPVVAPPAIEQTPPVVAQP